jgi:hypothetical protein
MGSLGLPALPAVAERGPAKEIFTTGGVVTWFPEPITGTKPMERGLGI